MEKINIRSNQFITNTDKLMSELFNTIVPKCDNMYFLVGYFYFSGYMELYEKTNDKHLRILVGMELERDISNTLKEVLYLEKPYSTLAQKRKDFQNGLVDAINNTDLVDDDKAQKAFEFFIEKVKNGTIELRKTKDPNHAKLYLFENRPENTELGTFPGTVVTGSSNLTYSGLKGRVEINTILRDQSYYLDGKEIFDKLWDTAIIIADKEHFNDFDENVLKRTWIQKQYSPYLLYLRVLHEYFSFNINEELILPHEITDGRFNNLMYQTDAIGMAINAIAKHNGAIIADVVGLGKSIIASAVAHNLRLKTIIISPPHLLEQWRDYKAEFDFNGEVFSNGKIDAALKYFQNLTNGKTPFLIIIDEAHKYRNEFTKDYSLLKELCVNNKVVLLSATPFNNKPEDIYSMLKLFQIPTNSTLNTVENLGSEFNELIHQYEQLAKSQKQKKNVDKKAEEEINLIAAKIRGIIQPLVVRRSRLDLEAIGVYKNDLDVQKIKFPDVQSPKPLEYHLGHYKDLYIETLKLIFPKEEINDDKELAGKKYFKAARYQPIEYLIETEKEALQKEIETSTGFEFNLFIGTQRNLSKFMRRLLVRRFESSVAAFKDTLSYMISSSEHLLQWVSKRNKIPIYKKGYLPSVEEFYDTSNDEITEEIAEKLQEFTDKGLFEIDMKYIHEDFIKDVEADIRLLSDIRKKWFGTAKAEHFEINFDPKIKAFKTELEKLQAENPKRKIIVFSEFADTVNYLGEKLKAKKLRVFKYTSADASAINKEVIKTNFDAGLKQHFQKDDFDILIATDAISEGYNLHRAGVVINYDMPYNPTRVIQRVGRINRVNKKMFDKLHIFNFFPTDIGEKETRTKSISTLKMAMIHAIMGEDTKFLTNDEKLNAYFKEQYDKELSLSEEKSWDTGYRQFYNSVKSTKEYKEAMQLPHRAKIGRKAVRTEKGVLLFGKKGDDPVFKFGQKENESLVLTAEQALPFFEAKAGEPACNLSNNFDAVYQSLKSTLFKSGKTITNDKGVVKAIQKTKAILKSPGNLKKDYLEDLMKVIETGALPGHHIRFITHLRQKDLHKLPEEITHDFVERIIMANEAVNSGAESIILAEEFL